MVMRAFYFPELSILFYESPWVTSQFFTETNYDEFKVGYFISVSHVRNMFSYCKSSNKLVV